MRPRLKMGCRRNQFQLIYNLGTNVVSAMTGNANFPTPSPTLISVTAQLGDLQAAITAWGTVGNRGSAADYLALSSEAQATFDMLLILMDYVENTAAYSEAILISSGFPLKNAPTPQGALGPPQDARQLFQPSVPVNDVKLKWAQPLAVTSIGNVKSYNIYRNNTDGLFNTAVLVGFSTKTTFIDDNAPAAAVLTYYIVAVNNVGEGAPSAPVVVATPAAL